MFNLYKKNIVVNKRSEHADYIEHTVRNLMDIANKVTSRQHFDGVQGV